MRIKKYRAKEYNSVGFLGGEITIYPDVLELIEYTKDLGYQNIHIISNARRFSDEKFLKQLIDNGITRVSVSIHSHLEEIENVLNNRNSFSEQLQGIKNLMNSCNLSETCSLKK